MYVRRILVTIAFVLISGGAAFAQLEEATPADAVTLRPSAAPAPTRWAAPPLHLGLAASFTALQAFDLVSTVRATSTGRGVEANPLMGPFVNHPAAFAALKGGATAMTLLAMRRLAKQHPKTAVFTFIGLNAAYAFTAASNLRVATAR